MRRQHLSECICDHMSHGCPHKEAGDSQKAARERRWLHEHHGMEFLDDSQAARADMAIFSLR